MEGHDGSSLPSVTGAQEALLLVAVDDRGLDGGLEVAAAGTPELLLDAHCVHNLPREGQVALGGDVDVEALELRAPAGHCLEILEDSLHVAGNLDPDDQGDLAILMY
jgi:hypothetical protein